MNKRLTLGTAKITAQANGDFEMTYMNRGSFLIGERSYRREVDAREFCRLNGLKVL